MTEILFVCTDNQFRSPIAAAYFMRKLRENNAPASWTASSAGTWVKDTRPAYFKAVMAAAQLGLDLSNHRTCEVTAQMLKGADLIVVMEQGHKEALECEFSWCKGRIVLLGEVAGEYGIEIEDPARINFEESDATVRGITDCIDKGYSILVSLARSQRDAHWSYSTADADEEKARPGEQH